MAEFFVGGLEINLGVMTVTEVMALPDPGFQTAF